MLLLPPANALAQDGAAAVPPAQPAQDALPDAAPPTAPVQFVAGTGDRAPGSVYVHAPLVNRLPFACTGLEQAKVRLLAQYDAAPAAKRRLDMALLQTSLESYRQNHCAFGQYGPSVFAVVDFAKRSSEPRLWYVDLAAVGGLDTPVLVAHGNGSDPDSDGYADRFSNIYNSRMSSLGAMRGAERYMGRNGLSLRLDGLEPGNNLVRYRDIVVHTARPTDRSYFSFQTRARLNGAIGVSDGCFVVEPHERERLLLTLEHGGFIYAGIGTLDPGRKMPEIVQAWPSAPVMQPTKVGNVVFMPGTGSAPLPADPATPATDITPEQSAPPTGN
jgi:hypothetical protein